MHTALSKLAIQAQIAFAGVANIVLFIFGKKHVSNYHHYTSREHGTKEI